MDFSLISRFSYKYRNYISDCGRFLIEVKEAINQDSTDPDVSFIFTTRDGDRITCKCQRCYSYEYHVSFYINDSFNRFESFSNIATYQQLKDILVDYLNNWF